MELGTKKGSLEQNKHPRGLKVLLVLTLINTGFSIISTLFALGRKQISVNDLQKEKVEMAKSIIELKKLGMNSLVSFMEQIQAMTEALYPYFFQMNIANLLILTCGATAAILMYRRNILGFHLYIIYNLGSLGSFYLFISPALVPSILVIVNALISLVFVLLYARHLSWLKNDN